MNAADQRALLGTSSGQTSARQRLLDMPEIFTGAELAMKFRWRSGIASTYLANWRSAGLVKSLGGRSDVHMNLVLNPKANPEEALRRAIPAACKIGADILREAGWTTQILSTPEVAAPASATLYDVEAFLLTHRPQRWFSKVASGIEAASPGLDRLRPAWALADMIDRAMDGRVQNAWLLDPEDIDLEAAAEDPEIQQAFSAFGLDAEVLGHGGYETLYEALEERLNGRPSTRDRMR